MDLFYDRYDWKFPNFLFFRSQHRLTQISRCLFLLRLFCLCNVVQSEDARSSNFERIALANTSDFYELVVNDLYVDKTLMITALHGVPQRYAFPSGWGKTTNLNMVKRFLEIETDENGHPLPADRRVNYKLFAGGEIDLGSGKKKKLKPLKIASTEYMKLQGKHPVIYTSFKNFVGHNYTVIEREMKRSIANLFRRHRYLEKNGELEERDKDRFNSYCAGEMDEKDIQGSLEYLSKLLCGHFGEKVYVLIDDYDIPAIETLGNLFVEFKRKYTNRPESEVMTQVNSDSDKLFHVAYMLVYMTSNVLLYNDASIYGLLTGMSTMRLFDKLFDPFKSAKFYDPNNFTDYHGFTDHEVDRLLSEVSFKTDRTAIRSRYGFDFANETRYNPWSIRHFLANKGLFEDYWASCKHSSLANYVLLSDEMQDTLKRLYYDRQFHDYLFGLEENYYAISFSTIIYDLRAVFFSSYLEEKCNPRLFNDLSVRDRNISKNKTLTWICDKLNVTKDVFSTMARQLAAFEVDDFEESLQKLLLAAPSGNSSTMKSDRYIGAIMNSLARSLESDYVIKSQVPASEETKLILISRRHENANAIILVYKVTYDTEELKHQVYALSPEINKKLPNRIMAPYAHIKKLLKIIFVFRGNEVILKYQIDFYSK